MNAESRRRLLRALLNSYTKAVDLEGGLRLRGEEEAADRVGYGANALRREIDRLRRELWWAWSGDAAALESEIRRSNRGLNAAIRDIERDVRTGERVAKALGHIDTVIEIAAGLSSATENRRSALRGE